MIVGIRNFRVSIDVKILKQGIWITWTNLKFSENFFFTSENQECN